MLYMCNSVGQTVPGFVALMLTTCAIDNNACSVTNYGASAWNFGVSTLHSVPYYVL